MSQISQRHVPFINLPIKIDLTTLPGLQPGTATVEDIETAQRVYELATLLSVKKGDFIGFERHVSRVKTYYLDYAGVIKPTPRRQLIIGLNLLRLLAQNRVSEFHTELELVPMEVRNDPLITYPLTLEQYIMEGSYSRVTDAASKMPDKSFAFFVGRLVESMREKIANCAEKAYDSLALNAAAKLLSLKDSELPAFCTQRGWRVVGNRIVFSPDVDALAAKGQVPSAELIKRSLDYARELEQII